ncbi:MAG: chorismate synthase, partial [Phycisphaerae bacterium]
GGRASARETVARVAAGAIAKKYLRVHHGILVRGYLAQLGPLRPATFDWEEVERNPFFCPDVQLVGELEAFMDALRILADRADVELADRSPRHSSGPGRAELAKVNDWAMRFFRSRLCDPSIGRAARAYLADRGFGNEIGERFALGLAAEAAPELAGAASRAGYGVEVLIAADLLRRSESGRVYETFRNRLMFPIRDATNRVVGFGGRTLVDDPAKYLNTRQNVLFDKGRGLYAIDRARTAATRSGRFVVVEGYTDCLATHQAGIEETVATLGTALTESQVTLMRRYCDVAVLLFDSDKAGDAAAERAISVALPHGLQVRLARIPDGKDPSDFLHKHDVAEFSALLNAAVDALEFRWFQTKQRFEADGSDAGRREAVRDFLTLIARIADSRAVDAIHCGLLVNQVAHLLRMDRGEVYSLMSGLRSRAGRRGDVSALSGAREAASPAPRDAEQAGWARLLEVVLNDATLLGSSDVLPDLTRIVDPRLRRIASAVFGLGKGGDAGSLAVVLAGLDDPVDVRIATELADRGQKRGNFENTFRWALARINGSTQPDGLGDGAPPASTPSLQDGPQGGSTDPLERLSHGVKNHRSFAPRRMIRRATGTGAPPGDPATTSVGSGCRDD